MRVISFGLWGNTPKYIEGAEANVVLARRFYPGWQCWFFCDQTVPTETINMLSSQPDCRVIVADSSKERCDRLLWRFCAASYSEVDIMLVRDADSRIGQREQLAVLDWLSKGTSFHIMRDSPSHGVPICGGMWGCHANRMKNIRKNIDAYYDNGGAIEGYKSPMKIDQYFLSSVVWSVASQDCTATHPEFQHWKSVTF